MKKILFVFLFFIVFCIGIVHAKTGAYSPVHVQHLKNCSPYSETYNTQIPSDNDFSYINLSSTETILGWLNGKCRTKSKIYSIDAQQDIMVITCAYSKTQLTSIIEKMQKINSGDNETLPILQSEMSRYANDGITCKITNLTDE